jgi:ATP-dependent helicase HrpA
MSSPAGLAKRSTRAQARAGLRAARRAAMPPISYPPELPVSQHKDEILRAIRDHQVVIIAGETGSGKTTQIPKICLELGRGVDGQIGHTQPRRLAARTVAARGAH